MDETRGVTGTAPPSLLAQYRYMLRALNEASQKRAQSAPESLAYKLDPGEPGVLRSATPAQSHAAVANQEQANIRRLSDEALARGEDVVSVSVSYKAALIGGKLALAAGRTEVASLPRPQADAAAAVYQANREAAQSLRLYDMADDAGVRSLSGGLVAKDAQWQM